TENGSWQVTPGAYSLNVGRSSRDLGLHGEIVIGEDGHFVKLSVDAALASMPTLNQPRTSNAQLEANKKLVLDFWHAVFEAENAEAAVNFLATDYIQHNPDMPQGCQGFIDVFSAKWKHSKHGVTYQNPPVIVLAEGDLVQL